MRGMRGPITGGTPVYDVAGKKLGTVVASHPRDGYLTMRQGVLLQRTVYVPLRAVAQTGPRAIYLALTKHAVRHQPWDRPPLGPTIVYDGAAEADMEACKRQFQ